MKKIIILILAINLLMSFSFAEVENDTKEWNEEDAVIFNDTFNHWGRRYVELLQATEIISGYPDGTFRPDNTIRVDEFLVLCIKSLDVEVDTTNNDSGYWAKPFVDYGLENNLVDITYNQYDRPITREEMAEIAIRTMEHIEVLDEINKEDLKDEINDLDFIKETNTQAVLKAYTSGLITGMPGNMFMPQSTATRAEASVVVLRIVKEDERQPFIKEVAEVIEEPIHNSDAIPTYLQDRFDTISEEFNLTWTDKDFENWYNSHTLNERNEFYNAKKAPPVFDFDNKLVLLALSGKQSNIQEDLRNLNDYNEILPIKYFSYIAYEMYKRNIEMLSNDGEDFGKLYISHNLDSGALIIEVLDGEKENRQSFRTVITSTTYGNGSKFIHNLKDQWDRDISTDNYTTLEEYISPYVNNITKLNYYFLHGSIEGQLLFNNYMKAFEQRMVIGLASTPNESLNIETDLYTVNHTNESGWLLITTPKE